MAHVIRSGISGWFPCFELNCALKHNLITGAKSTTFTVLGIKWVLYTRSREFGGPSLNSAYHNQLEEKWQFLKITNKWNLKSYRIFTSMSFKTSHLKNIFVNKSLLFFVMILHHFIISWAAYVQTISKIIRKNSRLSLRFICITFRFNLSFLDQFTPSPTFPILCHEIKLVYY